MCIWRVTASGGPRPTPGSNCIYATPHPPYCDQSIATRLIRRALRPGMACEVTSMSFLKHLARTGCRKYIRRTGLLLYAGYTAQGISPFEFTLREHRMSPIDLDLNIDSNMMMYALVGLLFLWLFFRIFKRTEKPRARPQVSSKSTSWNDEVYSR